MSLIPYILSFSLIGTGGLSSYFAIEKKKELENKIDSLIIYNYPNEINNINQSKSIIKIPKNFINLKNPIGIVKINKVIKLPYTTYEKIYNYNELRYEKVKSIQYDIVKKNIGKQILFPSLNNYFIFDKETKVLFTNNLYTVSDNSSNIVKRYEDIIRKNISNFSSDLVLEKSYFFSELQNELYELEENILNNQKDLYLLSNPINSKLYINCICDNKEKIIKEKFSNEINTVECLTISSIVLTITGIGVGIAGLIQKN